MSDVFSSSPLTDAARRRASSNEALLEGQRRALELALTGARLGAVLDVIARTMEAQSDGGVLASILLVDEGGTRLLHGAAPTLPAEYSAAIDGIPVAPGVGSCGTAAATRQTVIVSDIETDPLWADFKELAMAHGLRACWSTPILSSSGSTLGTFAVYSRLVATPTPRDHEVAELLSRTAALVIEQDSTVRRAAATEATLRSQLQRHAARMTQLFEHAPVAVALLRGDKHVFEMANPRYLEVVGGRQVLGRALLDALPELQGQGFVDILDEVRRTRAPYRGSSQRAMLSRGTDGALQEGFFDLVFQPITDELGVVDGVLVVAFEVTSLTVAKLAAEAARARAESSEHGLKTFIDNLPELAWTAQPDGHIDYYNRRWYDYTGTTFEQMEGWGWEKIHDPVLLPKVLERWKRSLGTGEPFEMEFTLRGADGIARWFLTRVTPARDASGRIVRWFGMNTNIDAIKSSLALAEAMAEQSRDTQRALLQMRTDLERAEQRLALSEGVSKTRP